jgi:hypothetical protein
MHTHGPTCLEGPRTQGRDWWLPTPDDAVFARPDEPLTPAHPMDEQPVGRDPHDPDVRHELVERIRREIAAGTYETLEKLELALDRLIRRLEQP